MSWRAGLARIITSVVVLTLALTVAIIDSPMASAAPIQQGSPTSGTTDVAGSATYSDTLASTNGVAPVVFTISPPVTGFTIANNDELESTGTLTPGPYNLGGGDTDAGSDSGTWNYVLTVTNVIQQGSPMSGTTDVAGSGSYVDTLSAAPGYGSATFTISPPVPGFTIANGDELESTAALSVSGSPYTIAGTDSDSSSDSGNWSYTLTVTPDTIAQGSPTSGSVTTGSGFSSTLTASSGFDGPVTFSVSTPGFTIANGDELESTAALSASASPYTIVGTDSDGFGDGGSWTYLLTVTPAGGGSGTSVLIQTSPTTGTVSSLTSGAFTAGPIAVDNNAGPVTFVTTKTNPGLKVSSAGLITTTGVLAAGTFVVSGTDSDASGDSGTWTYTLTVTAVMVTVTFDANGGNGVMGPETESAPTALSVNEFTWTLHTFVDWNTAANGSGVSYANGAVFPFSDATTLFAQWKAGKAPSHTLKFDANGGAGSMSAETDNTPTAISANQFTRAGYVFVNWNTAANGSGKSFAAGATYSFKRSIALYAQWKKKKLPSPKSYAVTFVAHGGTGTMAVEKHHGPTNLTPNHFTRPGYTFVDWNSAPNGSGVSYSNSAQYSFSASTTLYAQWKVNVTFVSPPVNDSGTGIGPFDLGSSVLSPALKAQIQGLASKVKGNSAIALVGYGDRLTGASEGNRAMEAANVELGRMRAQVVATYLEGQLAQLGLKGWTISIAAPATGTTGFNKVDTAIVIATLS